MTKKSDIQLPLRSLLDRSRRISFEEVTQLQTEKSEVRRNFPSDGQPRGWICCSLNGRRVCRKGSSETVPVLRDEPRSLEGLD